MKDTPLHPRGSVALLPVFLLVFGLAVARSQSPVTHRLPLQSPDGRILVTISAGSPLTYAVSVNDWNIVHESRLGLSFRDGTTLGRRVELLRAERRSENTTWENRWGKRRRVRDRFNEIRLVMREREAPARTFEVVVRA